MEYAAEYIQEEYDQHAVREYRPEGVLKTHSMPISRAVEQKQWE